MLVRKPSPFADGVIGPEWDGIEPIRVVNRTSGQLYIRSDAENLYWSFVSDGVGAEISEASATASMRYLDSPDLRDDGVGVGYNRPGPYNGFYDIHWVPPQDGYRDEERGGTTDGAGVIKVDGSRFTLEMYHPLASGDLANDMQLDPGSIFEQEFIAYVLDSARENIGYVESMGQWRLAESEGAVIPYLPPPELWESGVAFLAFESPPFYLSGVRVENAADYYHGGWGSSCRLPVTVLTDRGERLDFCDGGGRIEMDEVPVYFDVAASSAGYVSEPTRVYLPDPIYGVLKVDLPNLGQDVTLRIELSEGYANDHTVRGGSPVYIGEGFRGPALLSLRDLPAGCTVLEEQPVEVNFLDGEITAWSPTVDCGLLPDLEFVDWGAQSVYVRGWSDAFGLVVANTGSAPVEAAGWDVDVYLSTDSDINTDDTFLGRISGGSALAVGEEQELGGRVTVPASTPIRNYYIGVVIDPDEEVAESDDGDNSVPLAIVSVIDP